MNYTAIIQARMGSSRLPGKSLMKIGEYSILEILVSRLLKNNRIEEVIVATSSNRNDDVIENFASSMNISCHRGDENDVLARVSSAAIEAKNLNLVEIYGDSPLFCAEVFDTLRVHYERDTEAVITNALKTSFVPGLEMYIYSRASILRLNAEVAKLSALREHVGYNFYHTGKFNIQNIEAPKSISDLNHFHLEIDEISDLNFLNRLLTEQDAKQISLSAILSKLREENEFTENMKVKRRWKKYRDDA